MNATAILKYGQLTVLQAIDGIPEEAWELAGACGAWSVKDIVAHLASYEWVLVDVIMTLLNDSPTPTLSEFMAQGDRFNDIEVSKRKEKTRQEVLAEFSDTHCQVMSLIAKIPAGTLREVGTLPWYGMDYTLDDVLVYMYYGHKREHSAQIAAFRDRL